MSLNYSFAMPQRSGIKLGDCPDQRIETVGREYWAQACLEVRQTVDAEKIPAISPRRLLRPTSILELNETKSVLLLAMGSKANQREAEQTPVR